MLIRVRNLWELVGIRRSCLSNEILGGLSRKDRSEDRDRDRDENGGKTSKKAILVDK